MPRGERLVSCKGDTALPGSGHRDPGKGGCFLVVRVPPEGTESAWDVLLLGDEVPSAPMARRLLLWEPWGH